MTDFDYLVSQSGLFTGFQLFCFVIGRATCSMEYGISSMESVFFLGQLNAQFKKKKMGRFKPMEKKEGK